MAFELDNKNKPDTILSEPFDNERSERTEVSENAKRSPEGESLARTETNLAQTPEVETISQPLVTEYEPTKEPKDKLTVELEKLLEKDLKTVFGTLSLVDQADFQTQGELIVQDIREKIVNHTKLKPGMVSSMLRKWLLRLPGNNKVLTPYYEMMLSKMAVAVETFWQKETEQIKGDENKI